ncbi:hypothetical protein AVEN_181949-1 [Araneus ventricosus]|uniref:Uncharacterized protein n=1 Tax=Araneus ventricosus TaxID=182803 RepID=A0A4Y2QSS4_ARAVE|nr:hypothetical protein AVEN_181949-1 [Araneus ventricosus]
MFGAGYIRIIPTRFCDPGRTAKAAPLYLLQFFVIRLHLLNDPSSPAKLPFCIFSPYTDLANSVSAYTKNYPRPTHYTVSRRNAIASYLLAQQLANPVIFNQSQKAYS